MRGIRTAHGGRLAALLVALAALLLSPVGAPAGPLTQQERRGKEIYLRGTSPSGAALTASVGRGSLEVPGSTMPCANCHGLDGRGKPEGGETPSSITWEDITKAYGVGQADGRNHPPSIERRLERVIRTGLDPAGNPLSGPMPRYRISREDMADLLAYLKRLGADQDPGLTEAAIRIGTILPTEGPLAETGQAIRAVLAAYFAEINEQGGIHNRRIQLQVPESARPGPGTVEAVRHFMGKGEVFALVGPWIPGAEKELASLMEKEEVPTVGPFTLFPQVGIRLNRQVFYVLSGLREQARALVVFAGETLQGKKLQMALIYPENEILVDVVQAIEDEGKNSGWGAVKRLKYPPGQFDAVPLVRKLSPAGIDAVLFLGAEAEAKALMKEADKRRWTPQVLLPGSLVGKQILDIPGSFTDKVVLGFPTIPSDRTQAGDREYRALVDKYRLPSGHLAVQVSAFAAAKILVEGLRRAGRDASREKLIRALEGLYEFNTDLTPPITYGPNRRIGALGAHVAGIDLQKKGFVTLREWIQLE